MADAKSVDKGKCSKLAYVPKGPTMGCECTAENDSECRCSSTKRFIQPACFHQRTKVE